MSRRVRVAFVQQDARIGGAEVNMLALVQRMDRQRFDPLVFCAEAGPLLDALNAASCPVRRVRFPRLLSVSARPLGVKLLNPFACMWDVWALVVAGAALSRAFRQEGVGLAYTNGVFSHLYGAMAASRAHVPCVWHLQDIVSPRRAGGLFHRALRMAAARYRPAVMAISGPVAAVLDGTGVPVELVPNGTQLLGNDTSGARARVRGELGIPPEAPVAAVVGRITPWKGQDVFLKAAALTLSSCPDARFLVVGAVRGQDQKYLKALRSSVASLGIEPSVIFAGFHPDPAQIMRAIDLLVLPSRDPEPFGLVVIEAMAAARPVVATAHGGVVEVVEDGHSGLLVPPNDVPGLASAMSTLLADPQTAAAMGARGAKVVEERYSLDRFIGTVESVFEKALMPAQ